MNYQKDGSGCGATLRFKALTDSDMYLVVEVQPEHIPDCDSLTRAREEVEALEGGPQKKRRASRGKALFVSAPNHENTTVSACTFYVQRVNLHGLRSFRCFASDSNCRSAGRPRSEDFAPGC